MLFKIVKLEYMQKKYYSIVIILLFLIIGIIVYPTSSKNIIPQNYQEWNSSLGNIIYTLNENDRKLIKGYLDRHNPELNENVEEIPIHLSIDQAIKLQKIYLASPEAKITENAKEKLNKYNEIKQSISDNFFIAYISKENGISNSTFKITYAYKNKSNNDIANFTATLEFVDQNGNILEKKNIISNETIPANTTITHTEIYSKDVLNNFDIIKDLDSHFIDCQIIVTSIVFQDGKKLLLPPKE